MAQAIAGMKQMMPRLPEKYWDKYRSLISESELTARLIRVYDQHYTTDELKSLLEFYNTPTGKKMTENAVPILRESMAIAQELSRQASVAVMSEANAEELLKSPVSAGSFKGMLLAPSVSATPSGTTPTPAAGASP